ncbi:MAG TPA: FhaA domain-containing protein [Anaerolineales bacterium]|nr:FhaA domain-containing protein [Anaerolineales bacterium]
MDHPLSRFEARLQRLIEDGTARLFPSQDLKVKLAAGLVEAMHIDLQFGEGETLLAPCIYTIQVNSEHSAALKANGALLEELKVVLLKAASESSITLADQPVIHIAPQDDLAPGEFRVRTDGLGVGLSATQGLSVLPPIDQGQVPSGAFFIVGGAEIFPLTLPIVNIGRKKDNHLVIESPAVSRRHAQLRAISGHYHFFDLGSSGGSKINNAEVKNAILLAGDVIHLAGVPLIYGHEAASSGSATQEYRPGDNGDQPFC